VRHLEPHADMRPEETMLFVRRVLPTLVLLMAMTMTSGALVGSPARAGSAAASVVDSFNRRDSAMLGEADSGQPWEYSNGTWSVDADTAVFNADGSIAEAIVDSHLSDSFKAEADITLSSQPLRANAGLTILHRDHANHIFCKVEVTAGHPEGFISIGKYVDGRGRSLLGPAANEDDLGLTNGETYHGICKRRADQISWRISGGDLDSPERVRYDLSAEDIAAFGDATAHGLRARVAQDEDDAGTRWDNFDVVALPAERRGSGA
jgi:hypothetical protein